MTKPSSADPSQGHECAKSDDINQTHRARSSEGPEIITESGTGKAMASNKSDSGRQQSRQRNKKATSAVKEQRTRGQSERRQTQRAQRAADSQQQTVTITTTLIRSYYTLMTILYFTIQCYATYVLSLYYLYFTCTTCTLFVLLRTDPGPRHFLLRPPPPFHKPESQNKIWGGGGY